MSKVSSKVDYDAIVVGAGLGGLSAAAHLAIAGKNVLICERHNLPGGSASSFRRGRFEFESSLHEIAEIGSPENPGLIREAFKQIGAEIHFLYESELYRVKSIDPAEPYDATVPAGVENFCDEIERQVPGSRDSVRRLFAIGQEGLDSMQELANGIKPLDIIKKHLNFLRLTSHSLKQVMDLLKIPQKAQDIISTYWPYLGEPVEVMDAMSFLMILVTYTVYGAAIPSLFSHEISCAMDQVIRNHGGHIWYNAEVTKILIKNKTAYGVIVNGREIHSNHIISNAFPNDVFGRLSVDKNEVPEFELKKASARDISLSFFMVYLGLNKTHEELGLNNYTFFIQKNADPMSQYKNSFGLEPNGWVIINSLNVLNPAATPEGTCEVSITTSVYEDIWKTVKPEDYEKTKMRIAEEMISFCEKNLGVSLKPYIEEIEISTPATFARYLGTPNGTPYGYQIHFWDSIVARDVNLEKERTIKGLRFCGAHAERGDGYGTAYTSGEITANKTLADMKKEEARK